MGFTLRLNDCSCLQTAADGRTAKGRTSLGEATQKQNASLSGDRLECSSASAPWGDGLEMSVLARSRNGESFEILFYLNVRN